MRAEADDRPGRGGKQALPPYAGILGLGGRPFGASRHDALLRGSGPVREALETLVRRCRADGAFVLAMTDIPGMQDLLAEEVAAGLGEEYLAVALRADLLMTPEELLQQVVECLALPADVAATPESLMEALGAVAARSGDVLKGLVVQVEEAHELSADALEVLAELAELRFETLSFTPRVLLWGDPAMRDRLDEVLEGRPLAGAEVEIPAFTAADIRAYLDDCLRQAGLAGEFPFSDEQVEAIHQGSLSIPAEIDRLAELELDKAAAALAGRARRYPLGHSLAALVLLAVLALLYTSFGEEEADVPAQSVATVEPPAEAPVPNLAAAPAGRSAAAVAAAPDPVPAEADQQPAPEGAAPSLQRSAAAAEPAPSPQRSAAAEPAPAPQRSAAAEPVPSPQRSATAASAPPPVLSELERQHARLRALPSDHLLVQLMGSFSEDSARQFIDSYGIDDDFLYLRSEYQGRPWYVVVYGSFASRGQAEEAVRRLPAGATGGAPWIRSAGEVAAQIREN